jgi:hypothetical protein
MNKEFFVSCSVAVVGGENAVDIIFSGDSIVWVTVVGDTGSIAKACTGFVFSGMNKYGYKTNPSSVVKLGSDMLPVYCNSFCAYDPEAASSPSSRKIDEVVVAMTDESSISSTSFLSNSTTASTISSGSL